MARVNFIRTALNAGELSPWVTGRPDLDKYGLALSKSVNAFPLIQGPAVKRGGFRYIGRTKGDGKALLMQFIRSRKVAYVLEFGDGYIRFWTMRGQVVWEDGDHKGEPYEISSPYSLANLFDDEGRPKLKSAQSGDIVYLACPDIPPFKLMFHGSNNWSLEVLNPKGGPWEDPNQDKYLTITANGNREGHLFLTASGPVFKPGHVGSLIRLENTNLDAIDPWMPEQSFDAEYCRSDGKTYHRVDPWRGEYPHSGGVTPVHTKGSQWDGSGKKWLYGDVDNTVELGILWEFRDAGYGIAKITQYISETEVEAWVQGGYEMPDHLMGNPTWLWQFGAWSDANIYPSCCAFFRERLVFAGGIRVWMSKSADFENFEDKTFGETNTDNAVTAMIVTEQGIDSIADLLPLDMLVVLTGGGETTISESATSEPFGPDNVAVVQRSSFGSAPVRPLKVGASNMIVQSGGRKVREIEYSDIKGQWTAPDITVLAEHITSPMLLDCAGQQEPYSLGWYVRSDGVLCVVTRDKSQNVFAWHRHELGAPAFVEAVECIPSHDSANDEVYIVARLDMGNNTIRRFVCVLDPILPAGGDIKDSFYVDCGKTVISAEPILEIPTLEHLEGLEVAILADGGTHENQIVKDGKITLQFSAKKIQVGLGYEYFIETMPLEGGAQNGSSQAACKQIVKTVARVLESSGGWLGQTSSDRWQVIYARDASADMDNPVWLLSDDIEVPWPGGWDKNGRIAVKHDSPTPFNLLNLIFVANVSER